MDDEELLSFNTQVKEVVEKNVPKTSYNVENEIAEEDEEYSKSSSSSSSDSKSSYNIFDGSSSSSSEEKEEVNLKVKRNDAPQIDIKKFSTKRIVDTNSRSSSMKNKAKDSDKANELDPDTRPISRPKINVSDNSSVSSSSMSEISKSTSKNTKQKEKLKEDNAISEDILAKLDPRLIQMTMNNEFSSSRRSTSSRKLM